MKHKFLIAILLTTFRAASAATWYVDGSVLWSGKGTSWKTAFKTIQEGIDAADHKDTVIVAEGTYIENIYFKGKNIILRSTEPLNSKIVENTIIDGKKAGSVVTLLGTENTGCVLTGFTIQNGKAQSGGGILGHGALATIRNNSITGNSADEGGGLHECDGTIRNNTISDNSADRGGGLHTCRGIIENNNIADNSALAGGGLSACNGTIQDNNIARNSAVWEGGGLAACGGTIRNNTITGNSAGREGGGLNGCHAMIENNHITGNSADKGGGLYECNDVIRGNLIVGNMASIEGGGLYGCHTTTSLESSTIADNQAGEKGGGVAFCDGLIINCIVWANTAPNGAQLHQSSVPWYSCIQDWAGGGTGNINRDPQFVDPWGPDGLPETYEDNDYRLEPWSPSIDAGTSRTWMDQGLDLDGNPRIFHGGSALRVDMGAYEYGFFPFRVTEFFRDAGGQTRLTWNSRPGDTYVVLSRQVLVSGTWAEEVTIASVGETTTWTDPDTTSTWKFYQIELK